MLDRRRFLGVTAAAGLAPGASFGAGPDDTPHGQDTAPSTPYLTDPRAFVDVSRGNPKPHTLEGEALRTARLTADTWRLEVVGDGSCRVPRPAQVEDGTAIDLDTLREVGRTHGVTYLKAMQCLNIPSPLGQGLWEGVPLREVLRLIGRTTNVRRVYYWGFHNNDPAQVFQSSLSYTQAMESPPTEPPAMLAYRLNGEDISLLRGGPVRMVVPWAHGFKSIKWLHRIVLTNDYKANDTYALSNNDPESHLKTAAYLPKGSPVFRAGEPIVLTGTVMSGLSGLKRVEAWVRPAEKAPLADDHPAWTTADWRPCSLMAPPEDWGTILPAGTAPRDVWGFDPTTGRPRCWPMPYSMTPFSVRWEGLGPGSYDLRVRAVDLNGFAQPEPRTWQKSGMNAVPVQTFTVSA